MKPLTPSEREVLARSAEAYNQQLEDSLEIRSYLKSREIGRRTAERFLLGAVVEPFIPEHRRFRGQLVIPNWCAPGEGPSHVVGLKFRSIDPDNKQRYDQPTGQVARLFNLRALSEAESFIVVCEGELDAMTVDNLGLPAIGVPGAQMWKGSHAYRNRLLAGFEHVILLRDNDDAGQDLADSMSDLESLVVRTPPEGFKDVNEMWTSTHDAEAVRSWILG